MPEDVCNADLRANELLTSLTAGEDFTLPDLDLDSSIFDFPGDNTAELYALLTKLTNEDLTTKEIDGTGTFDVVMSSMAAHLKGEYDNNRITGDQYTKAYIAMMANAMSGAVQFLLGRDQAFWEAQKAQIAALTARIGLETAKVQYKTLAFEALTNKATFALTKMKLSTESIQFCIAKYNHEEIQPLQKEMTEEQIETQRSQTLDTRRDGITTVKGSVGKQKDLYTQQITSYQRDAEVKAAKIFSDAWITQKTIDEGLAAPTGFTNASLDEVLTALKTNNNLD